MKCDRGDDYTSSAWLSSIYCLEDHQVNFPCVSVFVSILFAFAFIANLGPTVPRPTCKPQIEPATKTARTTSHYKQQTKQNKTEKRKQFTLYVISSSSPVNNLYVYSPLWCPSPLSACGLLTLSSSILLLLLLLAVIIVCI